ncbi:MAG: RsmB/NOP family class I SAM-dependent RNA methyltransferase [Bacteroides sp.]|nr:RsmB/NOP family class I SAM-dependent RNA methyltransferase [Bacteroides sp.]MCM1549826.1 RsmB/NOP family class I SAM-dependent RNA methyltransferase [Clostridium sp.]
MKLPESFEMRMQDMLREDFIRYQASLEHPAFHGLRVNTNKISVEEFLRISPFSLTPVPWCSNGFYYDEDVQPAKHPYYFAGLYYIQEPSAMTPASVLPIEPGDRVLDICAAPGGKSTELAARLQGTGLLVSNDISHSRAKALLKNLELFGIPNMLVLSEPSNEIAEHFEGFFDKILIDAPCSGEGMFRKSSSMIKAWEKNGVELFVNLQQSILREMIKCLRPGGSLVYSTCTFSPEENEQAMDYLLELAPELELQALPMYEGFDTGHPEWSRTGNEAVKHCRRLWPHRVKGEGHFVAMLKKQDGECYGGNQYQPAKVTLPEEVWEFLNLIRRDWDESRMELQKERLYYLPPEMPDGTGLHILRNGLLLGELKKNRFEPSQSLAMALRMEEFEHAISLPVSDERVIRYLKGETIELEGENGLILFCVDGYPLGWGKLTNGSLKNKYLAGWRWQ